MPYQLTFWGTRGSIPTPGPQTNRYGGNTACLSLSDGAGGLVILDAGSGLRTLGTSLMGTRGILSADILLSHTHWDHIQGLPFFKPLSAAGNRFCVYGAAQEGVPLEEILRRQMDPMVFPVPLEALAARLEVHDIVEGEVPLQRFRVRAIRLRHPGTTFGYRLAPTEGGREIAYFTDNELGSGGSYPVADDWRARVVEFLGGVDTLIHDAMYADEFIQYRAGWGHSTPRQAVELAAEAGCARLILFHHEPEHDDDMVDTMLADARRYARTLAPKLMVEAAREGDGFAL
ncbi:MAG TPA: MBL fold metallo-hydrolase [Gemmatimonadales bacterium]|nr:MBL fold metallo-hydrolase [Gemmatimonadales bacterium]